MRELGLDGEISGVGAAANAGEVGHGGRLANRSSRSKEAGSSTRHNSRNEELELVHGFSLVPLFLSLSLSLCVCVCVHTWVFLSIYTEPWSCLDVCLFVHVLLFVCVDI